MLGERERGIGSRGVVWMMLLSVFVVLALGVMAGTAMAQDAPDCSEVSYDGEGTEENPWKIENIDQLQCMGEGETDTSGDDNFVQVDDIDASETALWNFGNGFDPVSLDSFGEFDGDRHEITELTIDRPTEDRVGLFGINAGTVRNVALVDVDITGEVSVGSIAGDTTGPIERSYSTGSVRGTDEPDFLQGVGGLVGTSRGSAGSIYESYSKVDVDGHARVGGLVGVISGQSPKEIENSYARGEVNGTEIVGGLVGSIQSATVSESYATGEVKGSEDVGGLIGISGDVTNSYWDVPATRQEESAGGGTGLGDITDTPPADEMTGIDATDNMEGFGGDWETVANDYPVLAWQLEEPANFEVTIEDTNTPREGDSFAATATITNTGDRDGTQTVMAEVSGIGSDSDTVSLDEGDSTTELFDIATSEGDEGIYTLTIESEDDSDSVEVEVTDELFPGSLIDGFDGLPQNTQELDPNLIEDLSGDGDGTDVAQTVQVFGELIRGNDLGLSPEQAELLNWNDDSPEDEVTVADMVSLFGEQIRA